MLRIGSAPVLHANPQKYIDTDLGVGAIPQPHHWFANIPINITGSLPPSQGHRYLFIVIDHSTRAPLSPLNSGHYLQTSKRITRHQSTTYNPAANGMVDCFHPKLKAALMCRYKDSNWFTQIPWVLLGLRTTPKDALDVSAAEMVYGDLLIVPAEFFLSATSSDNLQWLLQVLGKFIPCHLTYKAPVKQHIPADLHSAMHIFLHNDNSKPKLMTPYMVLFLMFRHTLKAFLINMRGKED
ncbi:uncharacterized protein [Palaemon carinicauda]|uniref:uncharacterized protein n=1 Tax=Palaemon carinicauda TaxID=392227 RepID=UPI0035B6136A